MAEIIISSGITSDSITLNNEKLTVLDGGTANNIKIYEKGKMLISSGGNADILFVDSGGMLTVFNGGTASRIKLDGTEKRSGLMEIESGGSADVVTVGAYSELIVSSGGTATTIVWTPGVGHISACDGATALFFSKYSGVYYGNGHELLDSRWEMTRRTISEDQEMYVTSNGAAQYTTVNKELEVASLCEVVTQIRIELETIGYVKVLDLIVENLVAVLSVSITNQNSYVELVIELVTNLRSYNKV